MADTIKINEKTKFDVVADILAGWRGRGVVNVSGMKEITAGNT